MNHEEVLIFIFLTVSDSVKALKEKNPLLQNFSPNQNYFFDEEVLVVYFFRLHNKLFCNKDIHAFAKNYLLTYFPKLPDYQAFNYRLNKQDTRLVTPIKLTKNKKEYTEEENFFNRLVSSRRQCVEIFGSWINNLIKIQNASKVRSFSRLLFFIFFRIIPVSSK